MTLDAAPAVPPWPHQPTVEFQVCGECNYACDYCIQSRANRVGQPAPGLVERMLAFLTALPGRWEIKMTGGEPFVSRAFLERIVPGLVDDSPHRISLLTNLSAGPQALRRFAELTRGRLSVLSASLHLDHTTVPSFLERLALLRDAAGPGPRFVVNAVLAPRLLSRLLAAKAAVEAAGFGFFPQLMKVKGGLHAYSPEQYPQLVELVGGWQHAQATRSANLAPSYAGRRCFAGARYLVLTQHGEAWACRMSRRHGEGRLGDVQQGVRLRAAALSCPYPMCPCAVPANRGMIEGVSPRLSEDVA